MAVDVTVKIATHTRMTISAPGVLGDQCQAGVIIDVDTTEKLLEHDGASKGPFREIDIFDIPA